jgi:hypothetical protein
LLRTGRRLYHRLGGHAALSAKDDADWLDV